MRLRATVTRRHRGLAKSDAARPLRSPSAWRLISRTPPRENAMPPDDALLHRVRVALGGAVEVEEKKMFGGIAFMVRGKMCVSVGRDRIMCRIDPALHDCALERKGCRTVVRKGESTEDTCM